MLCRSASARGREGRVENRDHRHGRAESCPGRSDTLDSRRVVEGGKLAQAVKLGDHAVIYRCWHEEARPTVHHSVPHSLDLRPQITCLSRGDGAQPCKRFPHCLVVPLDLGFPPLLLTRRSAEGERGLAPYAFYDAACQPPGRSAPVPSSDHFEDIEL
jgi:hypothetical protein